MKLWYCYLLGKLSFSFPFAIFIWTWDIHATRTILEFSLNCSWSGDLSINPLVYVGFYSKNLNLDIPFFSTLIFEMKSLCIVDLVYWTSCGGNGVLKHREILLQSCRKFKKSSRCTHKTNVGKWLPKKVSSWISPCL